MSESFELLMIGAMYENGGNTTHRFLDGHRELFVYPFESQVGTRFVNDYMSSFFPLKYRWPVFALDATIEDDYRAIIDEEGKVRARTPHVSKFRHVSFDMSDEDRLAHYRKHVKASGRSRGANVAAFFKATFEAWKDFARSGSEHVYVGYSPILVVDADKVLRDLPSAHFLHVVRNPWSAYADTKKRPVPLALAHYMSGWALNQYYALLFQKQFPGRMHILRTEDLMQNRERALRPLCEAVGIDPSDSALKQPSWNGQPLKEVYPWGTIRVPTSDANRATGGELTDEEVSLVEQYAGPYIDAFDFRSLRP